MADSARIPAVRSNRDRVRDICTQMSHSCVSTKSLKPLRTFLLRLGRLRCLQESDQMYGKRRLFSRRDAASHTTPQCGVLREVWIIRATNDGSTENGPPSIIVYRVELPIAATFTYELLRGLLLYAVERGSVAKVVRLQTRQKVNFVPRTPTVLIQTILVET